MLKKGSEKGFWRKFISFFSGSQKLPSKLEELVCGLIQDQKSVLNAAFDDKAALHETLSTWMDNYHILREETKLKLDNIKEKLRVFVSNISNDTLAYSEFKIIHQLEQW
jgi:hypothetical protein